MICPDCKFLNESAHLACEKCGEKLYLAKLRVTIENGENQVHYLFGQTYSIGRGPENDIVLDDDSVSRKHAEICYQESGFVINDNASKNGSFLNDNLFRSRRLQDLDCIQLGNVVIHFYDEKNKLEHHREGKNTTQWIRSEFFKYTKDGHANISIDDLLLTMLDLAISLIHADTAMVLQFDSSKRLRYKIGKKASGSTLIENSLSEYDWDLINETVRKRDANYLFTDETGEFESHEPEPSIWQKIVIPLMSANPDQGQKNRLGVDGILGVLFLIQKGRSKSLSERRRKLLNTIVQQIAFAVENEVLYEQAVAKSRIDHQLSLAKEIQKKLLPISNPQIDKFEIASFIHPYEAVSGDYFDFFPINSGSLGIAIGDICGKGVPAALLTSTVQAAIHSQLEYTKSLEQIISNLNKLLIRNTAESIFLTLFFGIMDIESGKLRYLNAGHPPPIVIKKNLTLNELGGMTPPLGIMDSQFGCERTIQFNSGDMLILYTDGIIESRNRFRKLYSRKRLLERVESIVLDQTHPQRAEAIVNALTNDLIEFLDGAEQGDDLTLLVVKRR
ncbi:MAG: SpoIIE family protein phosphatase [bacterium]